jgi:surfactin synthase thioesterase subunit
MTETLRRPTGSILSVLRPRPVPDPALRLYLLHHAGGSHSSFRTWVRMFPEDWDIRLVVAPGRPKAASQTVVRDLRVLGRSLAGHLAEQAETEPDGPNALFGHSMGGLVAFAGALEAQEQGIPGPAWVGVSGHPGPFNSITRSRPPLFRLPPEELRTALIQLDGLPERILRDRALWERVQPMVRADLQAAETWRPARPAAVLDAPLSAFCGDRDPVAQAPDAAAWGRHTTDFLGVRAFPGGHFYFQDAPAALVGSIIDDIRTVVSSPASSRPAHTVAARIPA